MCLDLNQKFVVWFDTTKLVASLPTSVYLLLTMSHRLTIQEPKSISAYKEKTPGKKSFKIEDAGLPFEDVRQREADFKRCCNSITAEEIKEIKDCFDLVKD